MTPMTQMTPITPITPGPRPQPGILDIAPYVGGEGTRSGHALAANENPLGAGDAARAALRRGLEAAHVYPDGGATALREAIARAHALDPAGIVCGNGSDELLALLCRAYAGPGDEVLHSAHGFLMYRISALAAGATPVSVPERGLRVDVAAMLAAVTGRTRILFLANPNNPTGSVLLRRELLALVDGLPERVLVVLDSAYAEYCAGPEYAAEYEDGAALVAARPNVVMTRTFSKIHGLAALRVGWAYAPAPVAAVLHRIRGPFNCNTPGLLAAAAAVGDRAHVARSAAMNAENRSLLAAGLRRAGLAVAPSAGNFLLVGFADPAAAAAADGRLRAADIRVRAMSAYGLPAHLRITVGTGEAVAGVLAVLAGGARV